MDSRRSLKKKAELALMVDPAMSHQDCLVGLDQIQVMVGNERHNGITRHVMMYRVLYNVQ